MVSVIYRGVMAASDDHSPLAVLPSPPPSSPVSPSAAPFRLAAAQNTDVGFNTYTAHPDPALVLGHVLPVSQAAGVAPAPIAAHAGSTVCGCAG